MEDEQVKDETRELYGFENRLILIENWKETMQVEIVHRLTE